MIISSKLQIKKYIERATARTATPTAESTPSAAAAARYRELRYLLLLLRDDRLESREGLNQGKL